MAQFIRYETNIARALELKMWQNGTTYVVYLGGLPVNIKTGYACTAAEHCEDEYIAENSMAHTELRKNYFEASKLFEEMRERWMV